MAILNQGIKKPIYDQETGSGVIPAAVVGTGTISIASGVRITGTGTLFTSEVKQGDYIYDPATHSVRRVKHVLSDLFIDLTDAFPSPITTQAINVVRRVDISNILQVGIANTGASAATVEESTLPAGAAVNFSDEGGNGPLAYNAQSSTLGISMKIRG